MRNVVIFTAVLILTMAGCQKQEVAVEPEYQPVAVDPLRDTDTARRHNAAAVELLETDKLEEAEAELKAALAADMFFGPAHNNLGLVYHRQKKYYLAAWEFQYATTLMPNRAEPLNNLGVVFEAVQKLDDAADRYEQALEINPDQPSVICNLARIYVRRNRKDQRTKNLLQQIVLRNPSEKWSTWASERLAVLGKPSSSPENLAPKPQRMD